MATDNKLEGNGIVTGHIGNEIGNWNICRPQTRSDLILRRFRMRKRSFSMTLQDEGVFILNDTQGEEAI